MWSVGRLHVAPFVPTHSAGAIIIKMAANGWKPCLPIGVMTAYYPTRSSTVWAYNISQNILAFVHGALLALFE